MSAFQDDNGSMAKLETFPNAWPKADQPAVIAKPLRGNPCQRFESLQLRRTPLEFGSRSYERDLSCCVLAEEWPPLQLQF